VGAFDRGVQAVERFGRSGPVERWRKIRTEIHREVCEKGFDGELNSFTQSYGSKRLDASLLMIPLVGFLPADDPRMVGTVAAIERFLVRDKLVYRYMHDEETRAIDGLPPGEGRFFRAPSGSPTILLSRDGRARPRRSFSGSSTSATTSV
jgi:Glucoamylase and related glycosyl hydrolases